MIHPLVAALIERCPFVEEHLDADCMDLPTVALGGAARALMAQALPQAQEDQLFEFFNELAQRGNAHELDILGTGAIELFNDDPASQDLARAKLSGSALQMLEDLRVSWGQPDYRAAK